MLEIQRIKMESSEEPQKRVFKARKTMRASDRQQLESVYKVKEELMKTTDVKLLNGKHENGDSDLNSPLVNSECTEDKEINGLEDLCLDSEDGKMNSEETIDAKSPDNREDQVTNVALKPENMSPEKIAAEQDHEDASSSSAPEPESSVLGCKKDNDFQEEVSVKDNLDHEDTGVKDDLDEKDLSNWPEVESNLSCNNDSSPDRVEANDHACIPDLPAEEEKSGEEGLKDNIGEQAISSSMDSDQDPKDGDVRSADLLESSIQKTVEEEPVESILGNSTTMETEEIIPILEKLAPAEDDLSCFSKSVLLPVENPNVDVEDKVGSSLNSPSKQESSENLPKEAFLVLSDEEELCCEKESEGVMSTQASPSEGREEAKEKELGKAEEKEQEEEEERPLVRSESSRRKRSKSEDMDTVHSKRRRYMGEEYEAEFEVKITTRGDVNQKLEKIIQRFLEEKFSALQYTIFDKSLADLKTRVDKVECNKRHKVALNELQAKIARLTKRYGTVKEDLKKRSDNPQSTPQSPGKTVGDTGGINSAAYRNAGTVRQMLESKRNTGDSTPTTFQAPVNTVSATNLTAPQTAVSGHPKPQTPVTSAPLTSGSLTTSVLPAANTATVVGTNQVASSNTQPVSVSLQSLPVILHVPVAMSSQTQLLQGHTGTLVTNQQSGSVEFIPVQSQSNVGNLSKTPLSLSSANSAKPNNSPSVPNSSIQRNSPASAGCSIGTTLAVQAVSAAHPVAQASRTTLATVTTTGIYTPPTSNRSSIQMKIPLTALSSTAPSEISTSGAPRVESQTSRLLPPLLPSTDISAKKAPENASQSGKPTGSSGVIDLTLDDEDDGCSQESKKQNQSQSSTSGVGLPTQSTSRPLQPVQTAPVQQAGAQGSGLSQTTIHVLPTAQTTVNVTHRPMTQTAARLPVPRTPANHQVVYTTLPAPSGQNVVRTNVMQSPSLRQVNPQSSGVTLRMPQTTAYVANNGLTLGSGGPQLTVHHRPSQVHSESVRPLHPAPLPDAPQPPRLPPEAANTSLPQKPHLKLARVQSQNGIVLSWSVLEVERSCASVDSYHLYAYHEDPSATVPSQWKKIGEVKALPLPMACTLTQFVTGSKYYFAVRAKDIYGRFGPFCDPQSTDVIASQSS
ncbi:activating transcription factor 7-interacting protein 1 isoform X2 [Sphaerodactylus townsendi]|uniref:activating transcription factor 7-interacting protein 1 isoform X2 n=1 Tax=Sphaerodactylus townsendi TaxID=933632 RepID=UPI00202697AA|nr:activating transcription factor 7-interacting protein 1 isoform X2 [Sphaerodactylus townsendi]